MSKLKAAIIGSGKIAQVRHIPEYIERNDIELVGICDLNLKRASKVAEEFGIPIATDKPEKILEDDSIDMISICTPNALHAKHAMQALNHKKHVLIEKPIATNLDDLEKLYKTAEKNNLVLLPGHNQRFDSVHKRVKKLVDEKKIGDIIQFTSNYQHPGPQFWSVDEKNSWFFKKELSEFGVVGDLAIHKLDLIQWLLDEPFKSWFVAKNGVIDDRASISLRTKSGVVGSINVSWNNPLQDHRTVLYGTEGIIIFGEELQIVKIEEFNGKLNEEYIEPILRSDGKMNSGIIDHFVDCIRKNAIVRINPKHVKNSLEIIIS
ncbi:Gfo/Idh/MocA family oxidoreductase [Bacillus sp. SM2101]|uniref:Gfo/Idh/MocA family protein n=1 Tax=Bacillus sp. SM2101 TaxID=2805366 RepID=UPI001BDEC22F|nr:Gfo/Idh/MocA family oxidoreductase [Bacillus sp. SM2101]